MTPEIDLNTYMHASLHALMYPHISKHTHTCTHPHTEGQGEVKLSGYSSSQGGETAASKVPKALRVGSGMQGSGRK